MTQPAAYFRRSPKSHDDWLTPRHIIDELGPFDLDPCSPLERPWPTAGRHLTAIEDGLAHAWEGCVWLNPPYGRGIGVWLERLALHGNGIALIFARTDTDAFHRYVFESASGLLFLRRRLNFRSANGLLKGEAGVPSVLAAYGATCFDRLQDCKLRGKFVSLEQ